MNERIEAYLKQHHCRDYFNSYGEIVEDEHYFMYREEVNGLIELIVRECAELAREWEDDYVVEDTAPFHSDVKIKQHFAVE